MGSAAINSNATQVAVALSSNADRSGRTVYPTEPAGIWVVNVRSGGHRLVFRNGEGPIAWSPDGRRLAFFLPASPAAGAPVALVTAPIAGGATVTLATFKATAVQNPFVLSWSPDGAALMLAGRTPDGDEVETYPTNGGAHHVLVAANQNAAICAAAWSPTGRQIAVQTETPDNLNPVQRTQIDTGHADGTDLVPITRKSGSCTDVGNTLAWVSHFG